MSATVRTALLALSMALAGCGMSPVDARGLEPRVPQPQDMRRLETPLYLILDTNKLPDAMFATGQGVKPIEVTGLHSFVERDLYKTMSQLFSRVVVAPPSMPAPAELFFTGQVLINSLTTFTQPVAPGSQEQAVFIRMQWSLHIRAYGAPADAFVYQATAQSTVPITNVRSTNPAYQSLVEDAMQRLLAHWAQHQAYDRLSRTGK